MDERKSKRTRADSVHVSSAPDSPPRIYRRFYDGCRIPSIRYHVLPSSFTVSLNGKRREQKRATHVHGSRGAGGSGRKRKLHFSGAAWRGRTRKSRGWEVFALGPERLCRCGNNPPSLRNGEEKTRSFLHAPMCVLESMNIYISIT